MFCKNCGKEIQENVKFCPDCGAKVDCDTTTDNASSIASSINVNITHNVPDPTPITVSGRVNKVNKHVFVWVGNCLFGYLGVDRFMRGQVGLGILKLITVGGFLVWTLIDFIISLVEAYSSSHFGMYEDIVFINGTYSR